MKSHEMKYEMILFYTMVPNRNALFQSYLLFVTIYGLVWSSSMKLLTYQGVKEFHMLACIGSL